MAERPVRFLVTCPARTGSTMLMWFLQSHPEVCAHGEVLAPNGPLGFFGVNYRLDPPLERVLMGIRDGDPVAFLNDFVWQAGERRAVGFKGKYEELLLSRYAAVLEAVRRDRSLRVIHLTRENLLARYLSQYVAVRVRGVFNVVQGAPDLQEASVRLSPRECEEDFRRTEERQDTFRRWMARHEVLELTYEELVRDQGAKLEELQAFLGVERRELQAKSRRLRTRPLREAIENFAELEAHFRGTPYERFFSEDEAAQRPPPAGEATGAASTAGADPARGAGDARATPEPTPSEVAAGDGGNLEAHTQQLQDRIRRHVEEQARLRGYVERLERTLGDKAAHEEHVREYVRHLEEEVQRKTEYIEELSRRLEAE